jgi:hypothetical protein
MPLTLFDIVDDPRVVRPERVRAAVSQLSDAPSEERGAVYTKPAVVDFILDLVGYEEDADLTGARLLEPSFGTGAFLLAAVDRLLTSYFGAGGSYARASADLSPAIRAVEVHGATFERTRTKLLRRLGRRGLGEAAARALADAWLVRDDFLLAPIAGRFTHVVGNPPYLRQERIDGALLAEYRRRYRTLYDRADLYIPFFERSLELLGPGGMLGFICADRWTKNKYGGPLRKLIGDRHHLYAYVDAKQAEAFETEVLAYPSIFAIRRPHAEDACAARDTVVARDVQPSADLRALARSIREVAATGQANRLADQAGSVEIAPRIASGKSPWLLDAVAETNVLRRMEQRFPPLEEAGLKVGIGVATGADRVFIRHRDAIDIEPERLLPLVRSGDVRSGHIEWSEHVLVNPYEPDGSLAALARYPRFAAYLHQHEAILKARHVAQKSPQRWYKTIDRVWRELTERPKLLVPDIKGAATIAYDAGEYYPHHNLYHVTVPAATAREDAWDLRALQAVLRSSVAEFFVAMYSVKMQGGYLRFQAQNLRRICVPHWRDVSQEVRASLAALATAPRPLVDEAVAGLYGLSAEDLTLMRGLQRAA